MYDVICMGSASIDLFVGSEESIEEYKSGDKVLIEDLRELAGGGAVNSSVALSRLDCNVAFLGKVGTDRSGAKILDNFKKEKVTVIPTKRSKLPTAYSVIIQSKKDKDRVIFSFKGASNDLSMKDFSQSNLNTKWIYFSTFLEESLKTGESIVKKAKKSKTKLLFNPSKYLAKQRSRISGILKQTDVLVLNKEEAQMLTKSKKQEDNLAKQILKMGPKSVIITNGDKGVCYYDGLQSIKLKAFKTKAVSTAGSGDAFASGFLAGIIKNKDIKSSLIIGLKNAASVVKHIGATNKLLTWKEVNK